MFYEVQEHLEEILDDSRILLEKGYDVADITRKFNINQHHRNIYYSLFKKRYGSDPVTYKKQFQLKIKTFIGGLSSQLKILKNENVRLLTCEVKFGDYKALIIISKDRDKYEKLVEDMFKKNLLSRPGAVKSNGLIFSLYQILENEDAKGNLNSYELILESYTKDLNGQYQALPSIKKIKTTNLESFSEGLRRHLGYFIQAHEMMLNNNA